MKTLTLENAPLGTEAPTTDGNMWVKVPDGWVWSNCACLPKPGCDWTGELFSPRAPVKESLTTEQPERLLAKHQPCGCVICDCEDDHQCQGCGAKSCGTHPVQEIPNPVYVEQEQPEDGPVAWLVSSRHNGIELYDNEHDARRDFDHRCRDNDEMVGMDPLFPASAVIALQAERDALRWESQKWADEYRRVFSENAELRERVKELEADAARLDWLEACDGDADITRTAKTEKPWEVQRQDLFAAPGLGRTLREAISAAMQEGKS